MRHPNTVAKRLKALLIAVDRREAELPENDMAFQQVRRDVALRWAPLRTAVIALCKAQGITEDAWCRTHMGKSLRTLQGYLQLAKPENWATYVKERRKRGNCGRHGMGFALELIAKPRPIPETKRGASASGNVNATEHRGKPEGQNHRTEPAVFRRMKQIFPYTFDGCAGSKRVALCERYSSDILNANVRGQWVWENGPFGMAAQLAAFNRQCGARHLTWLTKASVNTSWFHDDVLPCARHLLFPTKRLKFRGHDNTLPSDLMFVLYGELPDDLKSHLTFTIPCSGIVMP